jgi:hypothetical protein
MPALAAVLLLAASACQSKPAAPPPKPVVSPDTWATVDGHAITRDQVEKEFRRLRQGSETLSAEETTLAKLGILEDLIVEHVLLTRAAGLGVTIPDTRSTPPTTRQRRTFPMRPFRRSWRSET